MARSVFRLTAAVALVVTAIAATALPASANSVITATSVSLGAGANCGNADLVLGMDAGAVTHESGTVSIVSGQLGSFVQTTSLNGFNGLFNFGMSMTSQPTGSLVGSYAWVGVNPPSGADTAEWFVLYVSGPTGTNNVIDTCYGDYGTCPQTAPEALQQLMTVGVDDDTPAPGQTITVDVSACMFPVGTARLLQGDTVLDSDTVTDSVSNAVQARNFQFQLTVPTDVTPGTTLSVALDCGYEGEPVVSTTLGVQVTGGSTTTTTTTSTPASPTTTAASRAVTATPTYTG
jgi:hypothetical protein